LLVKLHTADIFFLSGVNTYPYNRRIALSQLTNQCSEGESVAKVYGVLAVTVLVIMAALIAISCASDWLEGGYVGQGSYSDIRQHFTDPIFYSSGNHYASSDPAIRQMEESMDRYSSRYAYLGSSASKSGPQSTIGKSNSASISPSTGAVGMRQDDAAGSWHLELSDGAIIDLDLFQSGARVFGPGSMASTVSSQWAMASGDITASILRLDVIPASGMELYSISVDISRLHIPGSYTLFKTSGMPLSGNLMARRIVTGASLSGHDTAKNAIGNVR
jgi:hypothetical protein